MRRLFPGALGSGMTPPAPPSQERCSFESWEGPEAGGVHSLPPLHRREH